MDASSGSLNSRQRKS